jgi:hypothetical protein
LIFFTSASFCGARMQGLLAGISSSSGFICAATMVIYSLPSTVCALAAIWIAWMSQSKVRFRLPRRESIPWGPGILSRRYG